MEFSGSLRMFRELPNIDAILVNPNPKPAPAIPAAQYGRLGAGPMRLGLGLKRAHIQPLKATRQLQPFSPGGFCYLVPVSLYSRRSVGSALSMFCCPALSYSRSTLRIPVCHSEHKVEFAVVARFRHSRNKHRQCAYDREDTYAKRNSCSPENQCSRFRWI
jgi:hypothetical protein